MDSPDLFSRAAERDLTNAPLPERMRPHSLGEMVGQEHLLGEGKWLRRAIEQDRLPSLILWGPPGTGKTTLARLVAGATGAEYVALSATSSGIKEVREVVEQAQRRWAMQRRRTLLFIDEIHRFNKAQQDGLLPHVERGTVTLIGATTENPSFEVNAALLSRCRVATLQSLDEEQIRALIERAAADARGLGGKVALDADAVRHLAQGAFGDARRALSALEVASQHASSGRVTLADAEVGLQKRALLHDKAGEEHYNLVSAFIKSMRGSDPDAAVYYLARMLEAGEDPLFPARRMVIFAAEDVGNADPRALAVAVDTFQAAQLIGMPEAVLPLSQAASYLALAPKSNAALRAYTAARKDVTEHGPLPVPMHIRNAPTSLMKALGYGAGYQYPHDLEAQSAAQEFLPDALRGRRYYEPKDSGRERELKERLERILAARIHK